METLPKLLTIEEVAEALRVHPSTAARYVARGRLPAVRLPGGALRVAREDLVLVLAPARPPRGPDGPRPCAGCARMVRPTTATGYSLRPRPGRYWCRDCAHRAEDERLDSGGRP